LAASAEPRPSPFRAGVRIVGLAALFLAYLPPHLLSRLLTGRSRWPRRFLSSAGWIAGVRTRIVGRPLEPHTLIVANHTSWLDILILGGSTGTAFVSKAEVEDAFLLGWLADQNRTLYIERAERSDAHGQVRRIADALDHPQPLTIFPEGTTGDGRTLLPFRSTLLDAVAPPPPNAQVRPVAIDFGETVDSISWHSGETGIENVRRVLGRRGRIEVVVRLLEPLQPHVDRKALTREARQALGAALSSLKGETGL
jgi:1-acyl-sn-glycerol-3-phosphate acyltransferase